MKDANYLFYIEPYVHVSFKGDQILLYNTLNRKILEYRNNPDIAKIIKHAHGNSMPYSLIVNKDEIEDVSLSTFIQETRELFMSDLLPIRKQSLPVNFYPLLNFQKRSKRIKDNMYSTLGDGIVDYLYEISLYINSISSQYHSKFKDAFKQFLSPAIFRSKEELGVHDIQRLFDQISFSSLMKVNIYYDLSCASKIEKIIEIMYSLSCEVVIHSYYKDILNSTVLLSDNILQNLYIDFPLDLKEFGNVLINNRNKNVKYTFIVENYQDFSLVEEITSNYRLSNFEFKPYYNEDNFSFFKENIFIDVEDLLELGLNTQDIFTNSVLNKNEFGKITILNNANVYSNLNKSKLGNIKKSTLKEILLKEIKSTRSWRRLRINARHCRDCIYNKMCPPLSSYEIFLKRNNLCNI